MDHYQTEGEQKTNYEITEIVHETNNHGMD